MDYTGMTVYTDGASSVTGKVGGFASKVGEVKLEIRFDYALFIVKPLLSRLGPVFSRICWMKV
jgi:hypothetical protein